MVNKHTKIPCNVILNDLALEHLMNLTAQEYYGECWDFKMKLLTAFDNQLMYIMGNTLNSEIKHFTHSEKK